MFLNDFLEPALTSDPLVHYFLLSVISTVQVLLKHPCSNSFHLIVEHCLFT